MLTNSAIRTASLRMVRAAMSYGIRRYALMLAVPACGKYSEMA